VRAGSGAVIVVCRDCFDYERRRHNDGPLFGEEALDPKKSMFLDASDAADMWCDMCGIAVDGTGRNYFEDEEEDEEEEAERAVKGSTIPPKGKTRGRGKRRRGKKARKPTFVIRPAALAPDAPPRKSAIITPPPKPDGAGPTTPTPPTSDTPTPPTTPPRTETRLAKGDWKGWRCTARKPNEPNARECLFYNTYPTVQYIEGKEVEICTNCRTPRAVAEEPPFTPWTCEQEIARLGQHGCSVQTTCGYVNTVRHTAWRHLEWVEICGRCARARVTTTPTSPASAEMSTAVDNIVAAVGDISAPQPVPDGEPPSLLVIANLFGPRTAKVVENLRGARERYAMSLKQSHLTS
jgi:hypothetical protein